MLFHLLLAWRVANAFPASSQNNVKSVLVHLVVSIFRLFNRDWNICPNTGNSSLGLKKVCTLVFKSWVFLRKITLIRVLFENRTIKSILFYFFLTFSYINATRSSQHTLFSLPSISFLLWLEPNMYHLTSKDDKQLLRKRPCKISSFFTFIRPGYLPPIPTSP